MDIHKEFALDVLGRESTEAMQLSVISSCSRRVRSQNVLDFIEDHTARLVYPEESDNGCKDSDG